MEFLNYFHTGLLKFIEKHGFYACNGILFNHESPRRGETFVTRKITMFFAKKNFGVKRCFVLRKS